VSEQQQNDRSSFEALYAVAVERFGPRRAAELRTAVNRLAVALDAVAAYPLPSDTEPLVRGPGQHEAEVNA
jgi:hypothetical protein